MDLLFQSIGGTEAANRSFGISLATLQEGREQVLEHHRGRDIDWKGSNAMYFETGEGSALSAEAHHGSDQVTPEARAYGVARGLNHFWSTAWSDSSVPNIFMMSARLFAPVSRITSWVSSWACRWDATSATQITRQRTKIRPITSYSCWARPLQLFYGRSVRRRCDAELSIHQLSRWACGQKTV